MEQKEAARNAKLINALEHHYLLYGSWDSFKNNRRFWQMFVWQYSNHWRQRHERPIPLLLPPDINPYVDPDDREADSLQSFFMRRNTQGNAQGNTQNSRRDERNSSGRADDYLRHQPYQRFILLDSKKELLSGKKWRNETYFFSELILNIN